MPAEIPAEPFDEALHARGRGPHLPLLVEGQADDDELCGEFPALLRDRRQVALAPLPADDADPLGRPPQRIADRHADALGADIETEDAHAMPV